MQEERAKAHWNLYYLFAEDKKQHPMPEHRMEAIRKAIFAQPPPKPP